MGAPGIRGTWLRLKALATNAVTEDCPPELAACQVCQRDRCPNEEWLKCERRLAAKRYLEVGNRHEIERLRQAHAKDVAACAKIEPDRGAT
jgi:hypothetical protein